MKPRYQLTPAMVRSHGGTVCAEGIIHQCRVCCFLNRLFIDEMRIRIDKEPIHGKPIAPAKYHRKNKENASEDSENG